MTNAYYKKELMKLRSILTADSDNMMVSSEYVVEKIDRILNGVPIGIHPGLKRHLCHYILTSDLVPTIGVLRNIDPSLKLTDAQYDVIEQFINKEHEEEMAQWKK